jgi:DNA repair exonuclease SbcCD nuclease subunit
MAMDITLQDFKSRPQAIIFSDLHIGPGIFRGSNGDEDMLERTLGVLKDIWRLCKELEVRSLICAGDLFDQANMISIRAMDKTVLTVSQLQHDYSLDFILLTGNHDLGSANVDGRSSYFSSINVLQHAGLATIVDNKIIRLHNTLLGFVPYMLKPLANMADMLERLDHMLFSDSDNAYIVVHQTPTINALNLPADFDGEGIANPRIGYISGHIHKPSAGLKGRILGSPCHLSADDKGQTKYVYALLEDGSLRAIPTNYSTVRAHIVQELAALKADPESEQAPEDGVYASPDVWAIMAEYAKNDQMLLVYIQQHLA